MVWLGCLLAALWTGRAQVVVSMSPSAEFTAPNLLITDNPEMVTLHLGTNVRASIIQKSSEWGPWQSHSVQRADQIQLDVLKNETAKFWRRLEPRGFAVKQVVPWQVSLSGPGINSNVIKQCTAQWMFDDNTVTNITGNDWFTPINKTYAYPGLYTVRVSITRSNEWNLTYEWAIVVTNTFTNLVQNGDLEIADVGPVFMPTNWFLGYWGKNRRQVNLVPGRNGGRAVELVAMTTTNGEFSGDCKIYPAEIPVSTGAVYRLSYWYKSTVPHNLTLRFTHPDGTQNYPWLADPPSSLDWQRREAVFTIPADISTITIWPTLLTNGSLVLDDMVLEMISDSGVIEGGGVGFCIDDGYRQTAFNSDPVLYTNGYTGWYYIVPGYIDGTGFLTRPEVVNLNGRHYVGAHTLTHRDLTLLSYQEMMHELLWSKEILKSWGIEPAHTIVYPLGAFDARVEAGAKRAGYLLGISTQNGMNAWGTTNLFALKRRTVYSTNTVAEVKGWLLEAKVKGQILLLGFHHIGDDTPGDYSWSLDKFVEVVKYARSIGLPNATPDNTYRLLTRRG
jgi:hypothetical protein